MSNIDSKQVIYRGAPLDSFLQKLIESFNQISRAAAVDPRMIPFNSHGFRAKTLHEAIEEAKGFVYGRLDPANFEYKKGTSIKDVLDKTMELDGMTLNQDLLALLPQDLSPVKSANGVKDSMDILLTILVRLAEKNRLLEEKLNYNS